MRGILPSFYKFEVKENTRLGRACFARESISKNEIICKMTGPEINLKEFFDKYEIIECNPLQIGADIYIDLIEPYNCFNHSCRPNAGIRNNGILFALEDIKPEEEITYDYSTTVDDVIWNMECLCMNSDCRKIIGDFQSIDHKRKEYYLSINALSKHILNTYY